VLIWLQRYMNCAGLCSNSDMYLSVQGVELVEVFPFKEIKSVSYSRACECIVNGLKLVAPDINLGTHSLHARRCGRCLKQHGR
jgi:hypothetical protein